jgi:hypothetical protein
VIDKRAIGERYRLLSEQGVLDERGRRLWAAAEARSHGWGAIAAVVKATGISESTVLRGLAALDAASPPRPGKVRRHPGRVPILEREPGLAEDLDRLIDPATRGDPASPLRWTSKSAAKLAEALRQKGHKVVAPHGAEVLSGQGYSLQATRRRARAPSIPIATPKFAHINQTVATAIAAGQPVISVDAKKRELVGRRRRRSRTRAPRATRCATTRPET